MTKTFHREYDRLFRRNPVAANFHLLLYQHGSEIFKKPFPDVETSRFIVHRFKDPQAYQLPGGTKR